MDWKKVLYGGIFFYLLMVAVFYFAGIKPQVASYNLVKEKESELKIKIAQLESTTGKNWKERQKEIYAVISSFQQREERDEQYFVTRIMEYCQAAGVTRKPISPLPSKKEEENFIKWMWKIEVEGDYHDLGGLLNTIETSPLFLSIENCEINARRTEKTRAKFILATYFLTSEKEAESD